MQVREISCGRMHEFAILLDKAGFNSDLIQEIINSKDNKLAKAMFDAIMIGKQPELKPTLEWTIWKTIQLGGYKDADAFRKAIKQAKMKIGDYANDIIGKPAFKVSAEKTEIILARKSVAELGFKDGATYKTICESVIGKTTTIDGVEYEITLCPNEVGPQLRLQYANQPKGEWLRIAMEAITDSSGYRILFHVERDDGDLWLYGSHGYGGRFWDGDGEFVFCLRKK